MNSKSYACLFLLAFACETPVGESITLRAPLDLSADCPAEPFVVGDPAGGFAVDAFPFDWHYSRQDDVSWAPALHVQLRPDVTSVGVFIDNGDAPSAIALLRIGERTFIELAAGESIGRGRPSFGVVLPMDDTSSPTGGCLSIVPLGDDLDRVGQRGAVTVVTRGPAEVEGRVDLNLFTVEGLDADSDSLDVLTEAVSNASGLFAPAALTLRVASTATVTAGPRVASVGPAIRLLRRETISPEADPRSIPLVFVAGFTDEANLKAISGNIPGPLAFPPSVSAGIVLSLDAHTGVDGELDAVLLGETIAHEVGHYLGLRHLSEADGETFDSLEDTPECEASNDSDEDGVVDADECAELGGDNLMFWNDSRVIEQTVLTPSQVRILRASPLVR